MEKKEKALHALCTGEVGTVIRVQGDKGLCRRYTDLGCLVGAEVRKLGTAPFGDPSAYLLCGAVIAIRKKDAACILVELR